MTRLLEINLPSCSFPGVLDLGDHAANAFPYCLADLQAVPMQHVIVLVVVGRQHLSHRRIGDKVVQDMRTYPVDSIGFGFSMA